MKTQVDDHAKESECAGNDAVGEKYELRDGFGEPSLRSTPASFDTGPS